MLAYDRCLVMEGSSAVAPETGLTTDEEAVVVVLMFIYCILAVAGLSWRHALSGCNMWNS